MLAQGVARASAQIAGYFSLLLASSRGINNSISRSPGNTGVCEKQRKPPAFAQVLSWLGPGCGFAESLQEGDGNQSPVEEVMSLHGQVTQVHAPGTAVLCFRQCPLLPGSQSPAAGHHHGKAGHLLQGSAGASAAECDQPEGLAPGITITSSGEAPVEADRQTCWPTLPFLHCSPLLMRQVGYLRLGHIFKNA